MENNKKRQHYIWKYYLKPWISDDKIWCMRKNNTFNPSPENIGLESYFYYTLPLNVTEQDFIVHLIKKYIPKENHFIIFQDLLSFCYFGDSSSDFIRKNGLENYHSDMEDEAVPFFNSIYKKDKSLFSDNDSKVFFLHFISVQYNRTKCMQERSKLAIQNLPVPIPPELAGKVNLENIFKALSFSLFTNSLANWLHSNATMYFLETGYEFIASDQPIINIYTNKMGNYDPVKDIELYYPITPKLALFFTEKDFNNHKLNEEETLHYNKLLFEKSHEQIFAHSKNVFEQYQNLKS